MARYKEAVSSAIWLQLTLVACYLPYEIVAALRAESGLFSSLQHARSYNYFSLLKLFIKSDSLLLEDSRSQTSG